MQRIFPLLPVAATLGIVFSLRDLPFFYSILLSIIFLFFFLYFANWRPIILILFLTFLSYAILGFITERNHASYFEEGEIEFSATIHTLPVVDGDSFAMIVKSDRGEKILVQTYLKNEQEQKTISELAPGNRCRLAGTLEPPSSPTNFSQFNYRRYLSEQGVFWILRPNQSGLYCQQIENSTLYKLQQWRQKQIMKLEQSTSAELSGVVTALLFGERSGMDGDVLDAYQRLGVIHLLAVSGLHVGMISGAFFFLMIRFGVTRERAMEVLLLFLPLYMIIAGAAPSVIRASCMTIVVLICLRWRINLSPLAGIVAVYMIYLLLQPFHLFHLGFQLSFLISFALLLTAPAIQSRFLHPLSQLITVTVLSQLFSAPILLYHMYEFPWISLPLNVIYIPFITMGVLPLSVLAFLLTFVLPHGVNLPFLILEAIVPIAHDALMYVASKRWSTLIIGKPHFFVVFILYGVIVYGCLRFEKGKKRWWRRPVALILFIILFQVSIPYADPRAKVMMLDVGQGDSFLIELPHRKEVYLIDTGGTINFFDEEWREKKRTFDIGRDVVAPVLKSRGIRQIDRLILTHGHMDHIGGAEHLGDLFKIKHILYGKGPIEGEKEREILENLLRSGAEFEFVHEGMRWKGGETDFFILSPVGNEIDLNERSIVIFTELEGVDFLFTGDLEDGGERRLVKEYPQLRADILKVGHHGSRTSTTEGFLNLVQPKAAFISAGRNSRFGHPHDEVVERLLDHDVHLWRSDQGAVLLTIKQGKINVQTAGHPYEQ